MKWILFRPKKSRVRRGRRAAVHISIQVPVSDDEKKKKKIHKRQWERFLSLSSTYSVTIHLRLGTRAAYLASMGQPCFISHE